LMWPTAWVARWFHRGFVCPLGAKSTFPISFPACRLWRGRLRTCVAERPSPAGTELVGHGGSSPRPWREGQGWPPSSHSRAFFSPFLFFPSQPYPHKPSRRRCLFSRSRSIPAGSSSASDEIDLVSPHAVSLPMGRSTGGHVRGEGDPCLGPGCVHVNWSRSPIGGCVNWLAEELDLHHHVPGSMATCSKGARLEV
jgi:hypothetical protein